MQVDFHGSGSGTASKFAYDPEIINEALAAEIGMIDLFLAGPPCQGTQTFTTRLGARTRAISSIRRRWRWPLA